MNNFGRERNMKLKKLLAITMAGILTASALTACGGSSPAEDLASSAKSAAATEAAPAAASEEAIPEEEAETTVEETADEMTETESASSDDFALVDVTSDMIDAGAYAVADDGTELVLTLFTAPDENQYVSLFVFDTDGTGDVLCGIPTSDTYTDEDNIAWTSMEATDVYTETDFTVGFAEGDDGSCYIFDTQGTVYEGTYLSADDTITYMGTAVALLDEQ